MTALLADRRGSVLVEFALVALVMTLLLSATIDLGRLVLSAQVIQDAARAGARELSVTPLPALITFEDAFTCAAPYDAAPCLDTMTGRPVARERVFDPDSLAIDITADITANTFDLNATCAALPAINRVLCPLMVVDSSSVPGTWLLRYPGALVTSASAPSGLTVQIPRVTDRDPVSGVETIEWLHVVEEIGAPGAPSGFSLVPATPLSSGMVALRINYPFQAATMSSFRPNPAGPFEANGQNVNLADEVAVVAPAPLDGATLLGDPAPDDAGTYAGPYGLGRQFAFAGKVVRPFRRLISSQAVFRREVFQ